jgi:ribosomal protein S1
MLNPTTINPLTLPSLLLSDRYQLPNCLAVYFVLEGERILYIGRTANLKQRWRHHQRWDQLKDREYRGDNIRIAWLECNDSGLLSEIETALIEWFNPELNYRPSKVNKRKIQGYVAQELFDRFEQERLSLGLSQSELLNKILAERYGLE